MSKPPRVKITTYFDGDVIRQLRNKRDISQEQLAELVGTGKANISKWELSRRYVSISWDLFLALAKALYVTPEELARRLTTPPAPSQEPAAKRRS